VPKKTALASSGFTTAIRQEIKIRVSGLPRYYVFAVAKFLIALLCLLFAFLTLRLWQFVATLLMRMFGVQLPLQPFGKGRKRAPQLLTFSQSVWFGVLFYGCGMWIATTLLEYLIWKYWNGSSSSFSLRIRIYAVLWPAFGLLRGLALADENRGRRSEAGPPKSGIEQHDNTPPRQ
jgi:hypothetical protein